MVKAEKTTADADAKPPCARREEILDVATKLFAEHGYADAETQALADGVGVGKGTIYRHFPSKRELFLAAVDRVMQRLHERLQAAIAEVEDPIDRVERGIETFFSFLDDSPEFVELLVQERAQFSDRAKPTYLVHRERTVERWRDLYRSLIAEGRVRDIPVERITDVITSMLYGAMFLRYVGGPCGKFSNKPEDLIDVVLFGILSDSEREARRPAGS
jgi:AcrR family transcriptional regulator